MSAGELAAASAPLGSPGSVDEILTPKRSVGARARHAASVYGLPLFIFVLILAAWHFATVNEAVSRLILPTPWDVFESFYKLFKFGGIGWSHLLVTFNEAMLGFLLASAAAIAIATLAALSVTFNRAIYPYIVALQVTPRIAVSPILIAALGFGMLPKIVIAALVCFFPILINILTGLLSVGHNLEEMFRSLRAPKRSFFRYAMVPSAMPYAMPGFLTGISFALIGAIVAEFISGSEGLGYLIKNFSFLLNMGASYAVVFSLTLMGLALFGLLTLMKPFIVFWESDKRLTSRSKRKLKASEEIK